MSITGGVVLYTSIYSTADSLKAYQLHKLCLIAKNIHCYSVDWLKEKLLIPSSIINYTHAERLLKIAIATVWIDWKKKAAICLAYLTITTSLRHSN